MGEWLIDDGYPWNPSELAVITITTNRLKNVARQAFQAGADMELEACCEVLDNLNDGFWSEKLRDARRPKAPSLKEQALADFDWLVGRTLGRPEFDERSERIRRALEQLPDAH